MPGVEAADFDCAGCGKTWTGVSSIRPGGGGHALVACLACGQLLGTMRCDEGVPAVEVRPANQSNLGFLRVYGGDRDLGHLLPRIANNNAWPAAHQSGHSLNGIAPVGFDPPAAQAQPEGFRAPRRPG